MTENNVSRETLEDEPTGETDETTETAEETTESEEPAASSTTESEPRGDENSSDQLAEVRREAAGYRKRLRETETELQQVQSELFHARVAATGKLADPSDMPVDVELLAGGLDDAIDELLQAKPHLKARAFGDIRQGERGERAAVSLADILRTNA